MTKSSIEGLKYFLDITADRCPMTFVKTRLMLDKMPDGAELEVRLKGHEPLANVPRSAKEIGCIVSEPVDLGGEVYEIVITKPA